MLTRFGFRLKILYLCASEEEKARKHWGFSSFFRQKNDISTSDVEKFKLLRKKFLGVCGKFFRNVGARGSISEALLDLYL